MSLPGRELALLKALSVSAQSLLQGWAVDALGSSLSLPQTLPGVPSLFLKNRGFFLMFFCWSVNHQPHASCSC